MICLSKNKNDEYVNMFANGSKLPIEDYSYDFGTNPIMVRSMTKRKLIHWCWENNHTFYYMDSGYVGNYRSQANPMGWKLWHRIVKNDVQHSEIIDRPDDRWRKLDYQIRDRGHGKHILLVTPSDKPCKFYMVVQRMVENGKKKNPKLIDGIDGVIPLEEAIKMVKE